MGKCMVNEKIGDSWQSKPVINEAAAKIGIHRNGHDENYRNDDEIGQHPLPSFHLLGNPIALTDGNSGNFVARTGEKLGIFFLKKGEASKTVSKCNRKGGLFSILTACVFILIL
jgi:hypothetical protein